MFSISRLPSQSLTSPSGSGTHSAECQYTLYPGIDPWKREFSQSEEQPLDVLVTVYAYGKARHLLRLLRDVAHEGDKSNLRIGVHVIDGNSSGVKRLQHIQLWPFCAGCSICKRYKRYCGFFVSSSKDVDTTESLLKRAPCSSPAIFQCVESFVRHRSSV